MASLQTGGKRKGQQTPSDDLWSATCGEPMPAPGHIVRSIPLGANGISGAAESSPVMEENHSLLAPLWQQERRRPSGGLQDPSHPRNRQLPMASPLSAPDLQRPHFGNIFGEVARSVPSDFPLSCTWYCFVS